MKKQLTILLGITLLSGCAATNTMISKRNLDVQTKMSSTIFLEPVSNSKKTIYIQAKNTSDKKFFINEKLKTELENKGYDVVGNLDKAHYLLQANILQVGKMDPTAAEKYLMGGYGSSIGMVATGVVAGAILGNGSDTSMLTGGLVGGIANTIANAAVKDVTYTVVTDLQISERVGKGAKINETVESNFGQGSGSVVKQTSASQSGWMKHQTRIVSTANKVNLNFKDALPELETCLANSIAGVFE